MPHTPGPWHATIKVIRHPVYDETGELICTVECQSGEQDKANAHLIASAPDLLAALEMCLDTIQGKVINGRTGLFAQDAARAAIARAKGESK